MLRIAVLDDDAEYTNIIDDMLEKVCCTLGYKYKIFKFSGKEAFMNYIAGEKTCIDILLLDIELGQFNGIDIASELNKRFASLKIIYLTSHSKYSVDISDTDFTYFLIKPINEEKLTSAIVKAKNAIENECKYLIWYSHYGQINSLNVNNIKYLESNGHEINIYLDNAEKIEVIGKLSDFEARYAQIGKFLRIHQSYLVNMDKITDFNGSSIQLKCGKVLGVSRNRHSECKKQFYDYVSDKLFNS